ncbi:MAG: site-specific integrase [Salinivirgaceae bacterium]
MSIEKEVKILSFIKTTKRIKNGEAPIFMRLTYELQRAEFGIKESIDPKLWDKEMEMATGNSEKAIQVNSLLLQYKQRILTIKYLLENEGHQVSVNSIKEKLLGTKENRRTVVKVFEEHNEDARKLIGKDFAYDTVQRYDTTLMHFKKFIKKRYNREDMAFNELTPHLIDQFEMYFKTERNCSHNTTIKYLKNFRKIILLALANNWMQKDPFAGKKFKLTPVDAVYLNQKELDALRYKKLDLRRLETVRDIFLFSCFTGLAFSDVKTLKKEHFSTDNEGYTWIHKKRQKTNQMSTILVLDAAQRIIDKYENHPLVQCEDKVLPVPSNQKMNAYLKELADICGIKKPISTHSARHTFATTIASENDLPIEVTSKVIGHSNIKMTGRYSRTTENKIKKHMKELVNKF